MKLRSYILFLLLMISFIGCTGEQMASGVTQGQVAMNGNKPPAFFKVANDETMKDYLFDTKDFSFVFPTSKASDFRKTGGWLGGSSRDGHTITLSLGTSGIYHIAVSTSYLPIEYSDRERTLEDGTRKFLPKRTKSDGHIININTHIEYHGQENYPCIVSQSERQYKKYGTKYKKGYSCYKFNPPRTMAKNVVVSLTYNKPNDPKLAKQYTYEDLQNRAKRVLNSLYIKDGW